MKASLLNRLKVALQDAEGRDRALALLALAKLRHNAEKHEANARAVLLRLEAKASRMVSGYPGEP